MSYKRVTTELNRKRLIHVLCAAQNMQIKIFSNHSRYLETYPKRNSQNKTLEKISDFFNIPKELLKKLSEVESFLEKSLSEHTVPISKTNIKGCEIDCVAKKARIISQTLTYIVLEYYLNETAISTKTIIFSTQSNTEFYDYYDKLKRKKLEDNFKNVMTVILTMSFTSQKTFSEEVGLTIPAISNMKNGETFPQTKTINALAQNLNLSSIYLLSLRLFEKDIKQVLEKRADLTREQKELILFQILAFNYLHQNEDIQNCLNELEGKGIYTRIIKRKKEN